jgi:hypothetical protein
MFLTTTGLLIVGGTLAVTFVALAAQTLRDCLTTR